MRLTPEQLDALHDDYNRDADYPEFRDVHNLLDTIDALTAELASAREREQAIEAAAYRKAAELCKNTLLHTLDPGNRIRDGILALISLSAQSALDEMIADREKRARETALREIVVLYQQMYGQNPKDQQADPDAFVGAIQALLDAPGSPSFSR